MTVAFAILYVPLRMKDLGVTDYYVQPKHLVIASGKEIPMEADNQYFLLVEENPDITITSDFGFYDLSDPDANELQYEHQGSITIRNNAQSSTHVKFIQIIIKN